MTTPTLLGSGLAACIIISGCGPDSPRQQQPRPAAPSEATSPTPQQTAIADTLAAAGVRISPLQCVIRRRTREIHGFAVGVDDALDKWEELRAVTEQTGFYPLIVAEPDLLSNDEADEPGPAETVAASEQIDAQGWFGSRPKLDPELYEGLERGEWQDAEPTSGFFVLSPDFRIRTAGTVHIILIPTTRPWEVAAYMSFGGWNDCPNPEEHVAIHRSWHERFGAEIVTMAGDLIEMRVTRPPTDLATAEALAMEQFHYTAGDLVYQGTGTLLALASTLKGGATWFFWWD